MLDLATGTGSIAAGLASAGYDVWAVDRSPTMLDGLRSRLPQGDLPRVRLVRGDVRTFDLGRVFPLVTLGATSVGLLTETADRAAMFSRVRAHLAPGGRFCFDVMDISLDLARKNTSPLRSLTLTSGRTKVFVMSAQRHDGVRRRQMLNIYAEAVDARTGATQRALGWNEVWIVDPDVLRVELASAGLVVRTWEPMDSAAASEGTQRILVECEADMHHQ